MNTTRLHLHASLLAFNESLGQLADELWVQHVKESEKNNVVKRETPEINNNDESYYRSTSTPVRRAVIVPPPAMIAAASISRIFEIIIKNHPRY